MCSGYASGMPVVRDVVRHDDSGQRPRFLDDGAAFLRLRRFLRQVPRHGTLCLRHAREVLIHHRERLGRVEVANDDDGSVLGNVVGLVELTHVGNRRCFEIDHAADRRVLVGVGRERVVEDDLRQPAVRLVLDTHAALFLHHLALALERLVIDAQRRHAIGFEPQRERQVLRRQRLPEHGLVFGGERVAAATNAGNDRGVRFGLDVLGALEHHVLEEMREPGATGTLVLRADVVGHRYMHDRSRVILRQDHAQPVRERCDLVLKLRGTDGGVHRCIRHGQDGRQCEHGEPGRLIPEAHTRQLSSRRATQKAKACGRTTAQHQTRPDTGRSGVRRRQRARSPQRDLRNGLHLRFCSRSDCRDSGCHQRQGSGADLRREHDQATDAPSRRCAQRHRAPTNSRRWSS